MKQESLTLVPLGCVGEIVIGGPQVTPGYLRPELNDKVFVDGGSLGRLYRTADLGRWIFCRITWWKTRVGVPRPDRYAKSKSMD